MTRSKRSRHSLAAISVATIAALSTPVGSPAEDTAIRIGLNPLGEDPGHDHGRALRDALEHELRSLSYWRPQGGKISIAFDEFVGAVRKSLFRSDDQRFLVELASSDAMALFTARLLNEHGCRLHAVTEDGVPDLLSPTNEGITAWQHVRKRMRKGKFAI